MNGHGIPLPVLNGQSAKMACVKDILLHHDDAFSIMVQVLGLAKLKEMTS